MATEGATPVRANPKIVDVAAAPCFTPDECRDLLAQCAEERWRVMSVARSATEHTGDSPAARTLAPDFRRGLEQDLPGGAAGKFGQRIAARIGEINAEVFGFRLVGLEEPVRVMRYEGENRDWVGDHVDINSAMVLRKLSFSVLLSDPRAYSGGDLEFFGIASAPTREHGSMIVFPSFLRHRVTHVEAGRRDVLVGWAMGPTFA